MIYITGPLNPAAFFSIAIITAQLDFKLKALPVNRCLTYLVVYTKLNSVGHIFHGGHSHESTGLTRSNNSIPRSINLLLKSFFIFWFKDDPSCKNSLQWGKIRHSYQAARGNLLARSGAPGAPGVTSFGPISCDDTVREYRAKASACARGVTTLTTSDLNTRRIGKEGKRERERFSLLWLSTFSSLEGYRDCSRVAVYRKGKKIYISPSWPPE